MTGRKKIKVALLTHTVDGRQAKGTAVVARQFIDVLIKHQNEFEITFVHFEKSEEPIYKLGIREIIVPTIRPTFFNRRLLRLVYFFLTTTERFDIIQWFQPRLYPFFWLAPARHTIAWMHGAGDMTVSRPFVFMRHVFNRTIVLFRRRISIAIAGSDYAGKDLVKYYRFDPMQIRVVNNGADPTFSPRSTEEIALVREKYELPEKFFLGVGRLIPIKNVMRTLQAFEVYCQATGDLETWFVHVGNKGTERALVDAFLAKSPYRNRITLLGYVEQDDLQALYTSALALVFPLLNEGFGLPAVEAMACGTPTVISATAAPEITNDDAVLANALDAHDIARGMQEIVGDSVRRARIRERGLALAKKFTWERTGEQVLDIYRALLQQ